MSGSLIDYKPNSFLGVPTLLVVKGSTYTPVPFAQFTSYYKGIESAEIAIPQDFKVIAGNSKATSQSGVSTYSGIEWWCDGDASQVKDLAAFPITTCSKYLKVLLVFPDCVNPTTLESAYSGTQNWVGTFKPANRCPADMKRIPFLRFSITYDLRKLIPEGWTGPPPLTLASGSSYSFHGDFINGWLPEAATDMLRFKTKNTYDGPVVGPKGTDLTGPACTTPKDKEPTKGTSDYLTSVNLMAKRCNPMLCCNVTKSANITSRSLSRFDRRLI